MNLPNRLTVLRMIMIPIFMVIIIFPIMPDFWARISAAIVFGLTSLTDMLDGKIARKYGLITDFGKFLDPVADKLMIIGAYMALLTTMTDDRVLFLVFAISTFLVIVREIAITSLRMIASNASSVVIAANMLGKIKTCTQITCVLILLLEPAFLGGTYIGQNHILSYISIVAMAVMTCWSGINYLKAYMPLLDPQK